MSVEQSFRELVEAETSIDMAKELVAQYQRRLRTIQRRIAKEEAPVKVGMRVRHPESGQAYIVGEATAVNRFGKLFFRYWGRPVDRSSGGDDGPLTWLETFPDPQRLIDEND